MRILTHSVRNDGYKVYFLASANAGVESSSLGNEGLTATFVRVGTWATPLFVSIVCLPQSRTPLPPCSVTRQRLSAGVSMRRFRRFLVMDIREAFRSSTVNVL